MDSEIARTLWNDLCSHGAWSMNKSHTVSYAMISYWCAYMKRYYPLEYAAACLRNAKDEAQTVEILRELISEGVEYTPFDADRSGVEWAAGDGKLLGGYTNLVGIGKVKARGFIKKRESKKGLTDEDREKLANYPVKHADLRPAHTLYGDIYENPDNYNIAGSVGEFATLKDRESSVVVCRLVKLERRDDNELVRISKRGYEKEGPTLFLDCFVVDDSVAQPVRLRLQIRHWKVYGEKMADRAVSGEDWFLVRGKWLKDFSMFTVDRIKCLTNEELFW